LKKNGGKIGIFCKKRRGKERFLAKMVENRDFMQKEGGKSKFFQELGGKIQNFSKNGEKLRLF